MYCVKVNSGGDEYRAQGRHSLKEHTPVRVIVCCLRSMFHTDKRLRLPLLLHSQAVFPEYCRPVFTGTAGVAQNGGGCGRGAGDPCRSARLVRDAAGRCRCARIPASLSV